MTENEIDNKILEFLAQRENKPTDTVDIVIHLGLPVKTTLTRLWNLRDNGKVLQGRVGNQNDFKLARPC